ncbi:HpsJ family protein [Pseudanabaena sp. FACHB-2040]|uniref:HpsJ-like protein, cyanoexosortase C-associated n=1 Tax=Pseudanabaena sp. FACHB-2040 TaxID=2692859 RepID=UPI001685B4D9|nr:HpsJ family protein [Pseudanabaena sp. FACHB-2040]MBD2260589.1 hypothetical protein [Pseudanabaena sp. FACHB-2040]
MVSISNQISSSSFGSQVLCRIVGLACIVGFLVDMTVLALPPSAGAAWRVGILQQMGDRSIILLFGIALIAYSVWEISQIRKILSYAALSIGVLFLLFCILVIRDSLMLQSQTLENIGQQAAELQTQVEESRTNPDAASVTNEQFEQATQQINAQAETLKQNAKTTITRASIASTSNFVVVGIGLISLGRASMTSSGTAGRPRQRR